MATIYMSLTVEEVGNVPLQFVGSHYLSSSPKRGQIRFPLICKNRVGGSAKEKKKSVLWLRNDKIWGVFILLVTVKGGAEGTGYHPGFLASCTAMR